MKRILSICATALISVTLALAADFWSSKPYTKWSRADSTRLLTNSPWAKTTTLRTATLTVRTRGLQGVQDSQVEPLIQYAVSIRSAMPIRQANARMAAILKKYDKMDPAARQQFDAKWNQYLETKFPDVIVVSVNYESNDPSLDLQLLNYFQAQTSENVKSNTWLSLPDGKRVAPANFATWPHEMQFAFPRPAGLAPDSSFAIEFQHPDVANQPARRISSRFSVKEIMFNGAPSY